MAKVADDLHEAAQVRHVHALAALVGSHDRGGAHLKDEDLGRERHGWAEDSVPEAHRFAELFLRGKLAFLILVPIHLTGRQVCKV